jgi:hypothetical protein
VLCARILAATEIDKFDDILGLHRKLSISAQIAAGQESENWGQPGVFTSHAPSPLTGAAITLALNV